MPRLGEAVGLALATVDCEFVAKKLFTDVIKKHDGTIASAQDRIEALERAIRDKSLVKNRSNPKVWDVMTYVRTELARKPIDVSTPFGEEGGEQFYVQAVNG